MIILNAIDVLIIKKYFKEDNIKGSFVEHITSAFHNNWIKLIDFFLHLFAKILFSG